MIAACLCLRPDETPVCFTVHRIIPVCSEVSLAATLLLLVLSCLTNTMHNMGQSYSPKMYHPLCCTDK